MIVLINGMQRSGSTFCFNVAREILEKTGSVFSIATDNYVEAVKKSNKSDHILIKTHTPDEALSKLVNQDKIKCICSFRNPSNAIESWMSTFNFSFEDSIQYFSDWQTRFNKIKTKTLLIPFMFIDSFPLLATLLINKKLTGHYNPYYAIQIAKKYDKKTYSRS